MHRMRTRAGSIAENQRRSAEDLSRLRARYPEEKISAAAFRLSGSGWYETDFKSDRKKNLAQGDSAADGGGKSSENTGAKGPDEKKSSSSAGNGNGGGKEAAA